MVFSLALGSALAASYCVWWAVWFLEKAVWRAVYRVRLESRLVGKLDSRPRHIVAAIIVERLMKSAAARKARERLSAAGVSRPAESALWFGLALATGLAALTWSFGSLIAGSLLIMAIIAAADAWLKKRAGKRLERFSEQLPSILKSVAAAVQAGSSMQQALAHAADQSVSPAKEELAVVNEQISLGMSVDEALDGLYQRLPAVELNFVLLGLSIQRRIGGNLIRLLLETTEAIEERRRLQRHLRLGTAQARLSAKVIGALPIAVTGLIGLMDPSFVAPLFTTAAGLIMLAIAAAAEATGFFLLRRIVEIKI